MPGFEPANIVRLEPLPYPMVTAWSGQRIQSIRCHRLIEQPLEELLLAWREAARLRTGGIPAAGLDLFAGGYVHRPKRGLRALSTHAWGIAFDFDSARNPLGASNWRMPEWAVEIAEGKGWVWGGRFRRRDPMHFQYASGY